MPLVKPMIHYRRVYRSDDLFDALPSENKDAISLRSGQPLAHEVRWFTVLSSMVIIHGYLKDKHAHVPIRYAGGTSFDQLNTTAIHQVVGRAIRRQTGKPYFQN